MLHSVDAIDLAYGAILQGATHIVPFIVFIGLIRQATFLQRRIAAADGIAIRLSGIPVGVVEWDAHALLGLPHERAAAVVDGDSLAAREEGRNRPPTLRSYCKA